MNAALTGCGSLGARGSDALPDGFLLFGLSFLPFEFVFGQFGAIEGGHGSNQTEPELGFVFEKLVEAVHIESVQGAVEVHLDNGITGFFERCAGAFGHDLLGVLGKDFVLIKSVLVIEPVLKTALCPVGDVFLVEAGVAVGCKPIDDFAVGVAVVEHLIDLLADGGGKLGDFAGAAPL